MNEPAPWLTITLFPCDGDEAFGLVLGRLALDRPLGADGEVRGIRVEFGPVRIHDDDLPPVFDMVVARHRVDHPTVSVRLRIEVDGLGPYLLSRNTRTYDTVTGWIPGTEPPILPWTIEDTKATLGERHLASARGTPAPRPLRSGLLPMKLLPERTLTAVEDEKFPALIYNRPGPTKEDVLGPSTLDDLYSVFGIPARLFEPERPRRADLDVTLAVTNAPRRY